MGAFFDARRETVWLRNQQTLMSSRVVVRIVRALNWCADSTNNAVKTVQKGGNMTNLRNFIKDAREPAPREADLLIKFNDAAREVAALREELNNAVRRRENARTNLDQYRRRQEIGANADRAWKRWTTDELNVLLDTSMSAAECATELGRSWDSVKLKRSRLGITNG